MQPDIEQAITSAANEAGIDPAFALAVADRESGGDPNARASKTIYGLFQMSGPLRAQYGAGNTADPYAQAKAWTRFIGDTKSDLGKRIGRDPTDEELYLAHYFGTGRAAGIIGGRTPGSAGVSDVFTPYERAINPEIAKAGTVTPLVNGIEADIRNRMRNFGDAAGAPPAAKWAGPDFSSYGETLDGRPGAAGRTAQAFDFSRFGDPVDLKVNNSAPATGLDQGSNPGIPARNSITAPAYAGPDPSNIAGFPANPAGFPPTPQAAAPVTSVTGRPGTEIDLSTLGIGAGAPSAQGAGAPG